MVVIFECKYGNLARAALINRPQEFLVKEP